MLKQCEFKDKEKRYTDKIKSLKLENKKIITLLKDSERAFYSKLQEAKRETQNLNTIIKQIWPFIKNKIKDPSALLKAMGSAAPVDLDESPISSRKFDELNAIIKELKIKEREL